jgi:nucleoside-diphosphate-sugar epimerase
LQKLIVGCGYLGLRVADLWLAQGADVYGVTRSESHTPLLTARRIRPLAVDVTERAAFKSLPQAETVLFAVGYDRDCGRTIGEVYTRGLQNTLSALSSYTERFIYVSSTGVYGQAGSDWVDESSPCEPIRAGGRACLEAERLLRQSLLGGRSIILRMAGIYGPGRIPRRRELEAGQPIAAPSEGYLNLIHVDDAARVVVAVEQRSPLPGLYCVSDGQPVIRADYYRELAHLIGATEPQFVVPPSDSPAAERAGSSKRVSNARLRSELGYEFLYPSFRQGLAAII